MCVCGGAAGIEPPCSHAVYPLDTERGLDVGKLPLPSAIVWNRSCPRPNSLFSTTEAEALRPSLKLVSLPSWSGRPACRIRPTPHRLNREERSLHTQEQSTPGHLPKGSLYRFSSPHPG